LLLTQPFISSPFKQIQGGQLRSDKMFLPARKKI
jgi:hypothetical protein